MSFFNIFGKAEKKKTFSDIKLEDLRREEITWKNERSKLENETDRLLKDESRRKEEYAAATSEHLKKRTAQHILDIRAKLKNIELKIDHCRKMMQISSNLILVKENTEFFTRAGVLGVLQGMDVTEVEKLIGDLTVNVTLQGDKLSALSTALSDGLQQMGQLSDDDDVARLMEELDQEVVEVDQVTDKIDSEIDRTMNVLNQELKNNPVQNPPISASRPQYPPYSE